MRLIGYATRLSLLGLFPQLGNFSLNIRQHVPMKRELYPAELAGDDRSFKQDLQSIFVLASAERAGYRQLFFIHRITVYDN
jgi:hypothetical protein